MEPPWVAFSQKGLEKRAKSSKQPLWLRISLIAYANVAANGHAKFGRGELSKMTGKCRQDIDRAIRTAIEYGYLHESSCTECLVPPGDLVENGFGTKRKDCPIHGVTNDENVVDLKKIKRSAVVNVQVDDSHSELSASNVGIQC